MKRHNVQLADFVQRQLQTISMNAQEFKEFMQRVMLGGLMVAALTNCAPAAIENPRVKKVVSEGLDWLAYQQHELGHWTAQGRYPTAMTALAGLALLSEGSTTTQGKYAENLRRAVDYLV